MLFSAAIAACTGQGNVRYSAQAEVATPQLVEVQPGVQVVEDYDEPVFYSEGFYWRYDNGTWYRSPYHNRAWVHVDVVPTRVRTIERPERFRHYHGDANVEVRDHRNPPPPPPTVVTPPPPPPDVRDHRTEAEERHEQREERHEEKREEKREEQAVKHDNREVAHDQKEISHDKKELAHDKAEIKRDERRGDEKEEARDRKELQRDQHEMKRDKQELDKDQKKREKDKDKH